jgi:hypothetical protein
MTTQILKTKAGIFKVIINDDIYINTNTREQKPVGKLISIGGKNTCVFIKISNDSTTGRLENVKTLCGGCEINDKIISGINTITMVNLAFTVVKQIAPHVKLLELDDASVFTCYLDDGRSFGISLALYELAFHQSTWYERHFGAKLLTPSAEEAYTKAKAGFDSPKPLFFDFPNNLEKLLMPIYTKTSTWKDFFAEIYKIDKKCRIMFPWYKKAVTLAMNGFSYEGQFRVIDIYKIPNVEYKETRIGGDRKSRKSKFMEYGEPDDYLIQKLNYIQNDEIYKLNFTKADIISS